ncbi:MAG: LemA family protein [Pseudomonadota bacterium]
MTSPFRLAIIAALLAPLLAACGVNTIPTYEESARAAWAQVQNQYQRRADLIPNLVESVQAYADQEREVLVAVTEARASATQANVTVDPTNQASIAQYAEAQGALSSALGRLLVVSERYPELRSNQNFLALQSQLEGTENRIAIARRDYIEAVRVYNTELKTFPGRLWASTLYSGNEPLVPFEASAENQTAPRVDFDRPGEAVGAPANENAPAGRDAVAN